MEEKYVFERTGGVPVIARKKRSRIKKKFFNLVGKKKFYDDPKIFGYVYIIYHVTLRRGQKK